MKNSSKIICAVVAIAFALAGCENEGFYYQDVARVRLEGSSMWTIGTESDSMSYNFIYAGLNTSEYEIEITAVIMGKTTDYDRTVNLKTVTDRTTAIGEQYDLPSTVIIAANEYRVTFPVTLKRTTDLKSNTVRMRFEVVESKDFQPGAPENSSLLIKWNDMVDKPIYWDTQLAVFFGEYSDTKYRFIIETFGTGDFQDLTWAQKFSYNILLQSALQEYNDSRGTLIDENGNPVTFPQGSFV